MIYQRQLLLGLIRRLKFTLLLSIFKSFTSCINIAGNAAIVKIFEGESDHLIPSVSQELLDNNMFTVAGRMIGHSFLHHGPSFPGLSPAIVHTLLGGPLETTPVTVRDCPDLDIRDSVKMVRREFE